MTEAPCAEESPNEPQSAHRPVRVGRALLLLILTAVAVAGTGVIGRRHDNESLARWTREQAIPTVSLVAPRRGGKTRELVLPGNVEAYYSAAIHAQVSGYVEEWRKDIGAEVRKGDVLAVIDTPELDHSIAVADSEVSKAKANLSFADVTASRWNSLRSSAAVSQQAADEKTADARVRSADVNAAQARVDRLKAQKAFATIVAPFDGVVTARNVDVGALVKADADSGAALFSVADVHEMRIYVPVPESYAAEMTDGMHATLELPEYPNRRFEAKIETTSHGIDQKSRTLLVELIAQNADKALFPGAFTRVRFEIPPDPNAVRIPASALIYRDNAIEVGALDANNRVSLRKVEIARDLGTEVEITSGFSEDERIVANPPDSIGDGEEVRIMNAEADHPYPTHSERAVRRAASDDPEVAASTRTPAE
jgi:RND family efflux transporter MFP subunit